MLPVCPQVPVLAAMQPTLPASAQLEHAWDADLADGSLASLLGLLPDSPSAKHSVDEQYSFQSGSAAAEAALHWTTAVGLQDEAPSSIGGAAVPAGQPVVIAPAHSPIPAHTLPPVETRFRSLPVLSVGGIPGPFPFLIMHLGRTFAGDDDLCGMHNRSGMINMYIFLGVQGEPPGSKLQQAMGWRAASYPQHELIHPGAFPGSCTHGSEIAALHVSLGRAGKSNIWPYIAGPVCACLPVSLKAALPCGAAILGLRMM